MKIALVCNDFNYYQKAIGDALAEETEGNFSFIEMRSLSESDRVKGWQAYSAPYVIAYDEKREQAERLLREADVLILTGVPVRLTRTLAANRNGEKLIFAYHERPFKKGYTPQYYVPRWLKYHYMYGRNQGMYLLSASSFASADFDRMGLFRGRCYKWGYLPTSSSKAEDELLAGKEPDTLVWVGRYVDWKHPEVAIEVAKQLLSDGCPIRLRMVGRGELESHIRDRVTAEGLGDHIHVLGAMTNEETREVMEKSEIFLFTSDRNEGWGVVLNEAMSSACVPVACPEIGAIPYMIRDGENGIVYRRSSLSRAVKEIRRLLEKRGDRQSMQRSAYRTIMDAWNPQEAAKRFVRLAAGLKSGDAPRYESGPCSEAEVVGDDWYQERD